MAGHSTGELHCTALHSTAPLCEEWTEMRLGGRQAQATLHRAREGDGGAESEIHAVCASVLVVCCLSLLLLFVFVCLLWLLLLCPPFHSCSAVRCDQTKRKKRTNNTTHDTRDTHTTRHNTHTTSPSHLMRVCGVSGVVGLGWSVVVWLRRNCRDAHTVKSTQQDHTHHTPTNQQKRPQPIVCPCSHPFLASPLLPPQVACAAMSSDLDTRQSMRDFGSYPTYTTTQTNGRKGHNVFVRHKTNNNTPRRTVEQLTVLA